jgi:hypothetical protein
MTDIMSMGGIVVLLDGRDGVGYGQCGKSIPYRHHE